MRQQDQPQHCQRACLHALEIMEAVAVVEGWEEMRFEDMTAYADAAESRNEPITWSAGASVSECE